MVRVKLSELIDPNRCTKIHKCEKRCLMDKDHKDKHFDENMHQW